MASTLIDALGHRYQHIHWTKDQIKVLKLVFEGRMTYQQISRHTGVALGTMKGWISNPDFQERLTEMRNEMLDSLDALRIAYVRTEQRVIALSKMAEAARQEFERSPTISEQRVVGYDKDTREPLIITNETFNESAHKAFRDTLAEIAKELGQRQTPVKLTDRYGKDVFDTTIIAAETDERFAGFLARVTETRVLGVVESGAEE